MKKKILISLLIAICIFTSFAYTILISKNVEKIYAIDFPALGSEVDYNLKVDSDIDPVNKWKNKNISESNIIEVKNNFDSQELKNLKRIFKLDNCKEKTDKDKFINISDGSKFLEIHPNGTFMYADEDKRNSNKKMLLDDSQCVSIAESFLKENNLLPPEAICSGVLSNTLTYVDDPESKEVVSKSVRFDRFIDSKEVYGVSRVMVIIGADGDIISLYYNCRTINNNKIKKVRLRDIESAFEDVKHQKGMISVKDDAKEVVIKDVDIVYWEDSTPSSKNNYLQPVYRFRGESNNKEGKKDKFFAIVSAISDELTVKEEYTPHITSDKKELLK